MEATSQGPRKAMPRIMSHEEQVRQSEDIAQLLHESEIRAIESDWEFRSDGVQPGHTEARWVMTPHGPELVIVGYA